MQDRVMSFGNVELNHAKDGDDKNAAEMVVARGFGSVVRHRSDEERSSVYETLLELEEKAKQVQTHTLLACKKCLGCVLLGHVCDV
jgi:hypothetical protein